jgi:murein DD-endopeptidase MepM/ murein hydrolase activator NlpD
MRPFTPPEERWLSGHRGVDLLAPGPGATVLAPAPGRIRFSGRVGGKDVVVLEHAEGLRSTFEPAISSLPVGTAVARGQALAAVAPSPGHCAPTTCLHWGVLRGEVYLDPLSFIGPQRVRLLPSH